jgi:hypothetical protein
VVAEFLPQHLLGLRIEEVDRRRDDAFPLLLRARRGAIRSWEDRVRRRSLSAVRWALRHRAAILPHHEHPHRGLGG